MDLIRRNQGRLAAREPKFRLVASGGSMEALKPQVAGLTLAPGQRGQLRLQGFGLGIAGDMPGTERLWASHFTPAGVKILDVYGEGVSTAVIVFQNPPNIAGQAAVASGPLLIIAVLGAAILTLAVLGWTISRATLFVEAVGPVAGTLLIGGLVIVGLLLVAPILARKAR